MIVTHSRSETLFEFSDKVIEGLLKQGDFVGADPELNKSTISTTKFLTHVLDESVLQGTAVSSRSESPSI